MTNFNLSNNYAIFLTLLKQPSFIWSFVKKSSVYPDTAIFRSLKSLSVTFVILVNFLRHGAKQFGKHTNLYNLSRNSNFDAVHFKIGVLYVFVQLLQVKY